MNLHCSQTSAFDATHGYMFVTPMNLHCSQTVMNIYILVMCLLPL